MILLIIFFLLLIGALAAYWLPPQQRTLDIAVSLLPAAALAVLLLRPPLPEAFTIPWSPASLFPEPLTFRAGEQAVAFAAFFCGLLILIEWTRPLRRGPAQASRAAIYLLAVSGIVACFASTPLAVFIVWAWIDFISFLVVFFLKSPVEIGPGGISSPLSRSGGVLAVNLLGSILVLFSLFIGSPSPPFDWSGLGNSSPQELSVVLFLTGIALRLIVAPLQFTFPRIRTISTGVEILIRIVSPAAVLCFLSTAWSSLPFASAGAAAFTWVAAPCGLTLLISGWRWCAASSPLARRDAFFPILPGFAFLSALLLPTEAGVFTSAGALLILGGGLLMVYIGYLPHRRWMAGFLLLLAVLLAGIPFSPMAVWATTVYPGILNSSGVGAVAGLALIHLFVLCAVVRTALDPVEEFPSNEPVYLITFSLGMGACLLMLLASGRPGAVSLPSAAASLLLLAGGVLLLFLFIRLQRIGGSFLRLPGRFLRPDGFSRAAADAFRRTAFLFSGAESFLSGEGAMLWSLGIALLLYLVFRGG